MAQLRKLYVNVEDENGAPISSPTVSVLRTGAVITRDASTGVAKIGVEHPGGLRENDVCYVLRSGSIISGLTVTIADPVWEYAPSNDDWITEYFSVGSWTPTAGDRLVLTGLTSSHFLEAYDSDSKSGTPTTSSFSGSALGIVEVWVSARDADIKVESGGSTLYLVDIEAGANRPTIDGDITLSGVYDADLFAETIPAHFLRHKNAVRFTAWGVATDVATGTKVVTLKLGTTTLAQISVAAGVTTDWRIEAIIMGNRDNGTQHISVKGWEGSTQEGWDASLEATEDETTALSLRIEAQTSFASEIITINGAIVEYLEG